VLRSRWNGRPGRLEVWYTTLTDPATGTGLWLHHELVAPTHRARRPYAHGWVALFPPGGAPTLTRFGPVPWRRPAPPAVFTAGPVTVTPERLSGEAGDAAWDLTAEGGGRPLYTFPRWAWDYGLLPAAQVVPAPTARFTGTVRCGQSTVDLDGAPGATARIYGHGNAHRWGWLHADLGGGDVCEVVAAVSTRPGLNRLPPLPLVRLRVDGVDLPEGDPLLAGLRFRARLDRPVWRVHGRFADRRLTITVTQPADRTVSVDYTNPDRSTAVCHNTERADVAITLDRYGPDGWRRERWWYLKGTAHAEIGMSTAR
jgi:hypothetical protein